MARFHSFYGWVIFRCVYVHHIFFICSFPDGHLGSSHILAIVNNAVMNIMVHILFLICVFVFLRQIPSGLPQWLSSKEPTCNAGAQEIQVQSLHQEDPLEKSMATHSNIFAWKIPWTEEPGGLQSMGSQRARHDWTTNTFRTLGTYCLQNCTCALEWILLKASSNFMVNYFMAYFCHFHTFLQRRNSIPLIE